MSKYSRRFYANIEATSKQSAGRVLPLVVDYVAPQSVADLGCGNGAWLQTAREIGITDVVGLDGEYVKPESLLIPAECFRPADVSKPVDLGRRFDLAMCLEVGEHVTSADAPTLVASLTRLAPVVLFSAAVPGQGGVGHVNEQWPPFWAELFAGHGYEAIDCLRPAIWNDPDVEWWYAQNLLLFASQEAIGANPKLAQARAATRSGQLAVVHPRALECTIERLASPTRASLRYLARMSWHAFRNDTRRALARFGVGGASTGR